MSNTRASSPLTPDYWDRAWAAHRDASGFYRKTSEVRAGAARSDTTRSDTTKEFWNERARQFSRNTTGEAGAGRVEIVFDWLERRGVVPGEGRVLDLGSGPGSFAVPFAEAGAAVTALDSSPEMIRLLHDNMAAAGVGSYGAVEQRWEDLDIDSLGWRGAFDLVFISMCPAVGNREMLEKALACSRGAVYIVVFAGKRESEAYSALWEQLCPGTPPPGVPDDAFYLGNLLYTLHCDFESSIYSWSYTTELTAEEARAFFTTGLRRRAPELDGDSIDRAVAAYLGSHCASDGRLYNTVNNRHGRFLVRV